MFYLGFSSFLLDIKWFSLSIRGTSHFLLHRFIFYKTIQRYDFYLCLVLL